MNTFYTLELIVKSGLSSSSCRNKNAKSGLKYDILSPSSRLLPQQQMEFVLIRFSFLILLFGLSQQSLANSFGVYIPNKNKYEFPLEAGIGVEYGGLGVQYIMSVPNSNASFYLTTGAISLINPDEVEYNFYLSGAGVNFELDRHSSFGIYGGAMDRESVYTGFGTTEKEMIYGLSVNYKVQLFRSNFYLGASYSAHKNDHFPMLSISYRY